MLEWKIPEFDYKLVLMMKETDPWAFWGYGLHVGLVIGLLGYGVFSFFFERRRVKRKRQHTVITFADAKERRRMK